MLRLDFWPMRRSAPLPINQKLDLIAALQTPLHVSMPLATALICCTEEAIQPLVAMA